MESVISLHLCVDLSYGIIMFCFIQLVILFSYQFINAQVDIHAHHVLTWAAGDVVCAARCGQVERLNYTLV